MSSNEYISELLHEFLNSLPEVAPRPASMVKLGIAIASTALKAVLNAPPDVGFFGTEYNIYGFYICLGLLFFFGIGLIIVSWFVADDADGYNAVMRTVTRASQIMLVFAMALYKV
jgi:Protein of unknown function (DUF3681)